MDHMPEIKAEKKSTNVVDLFQKLKLVNPPQQNQESLKS